MKKLFFLASLLILALSNLVKAQTITLTPNPNPANSGGAITFTVSGETTGYYVTNITFDNFDSTIPSNASPGVVTNIFTYSGQKATTFQDFATLSSGSPATPVTFAFTIQMYDASIPGYTNITVKSTVTINATASTPPSPPPTIPNGGTNSNCIYRLYCAHDNMHFYTTSRAEVETMLNNNGSSYPYTWAYEGVMGYAWTQPQTGTTPLLRFYNPSTGQHMYTTSPSEETTLQNMGYNYESIMGYVSATSKTNYEPMYRYNTSSGHFFTINYSEEGGGNSGYTYEGIPFYVLSSAQ